MGPTKGITRVNDVRTRVDDSDSGADLAVFHSIGKALTSTLNLSEVLSIIMEQISALFNPSHWSLLLHDEDRRQLRFEIVVGGSATRLHGTWMSIDRGIAGWVAREATPVIARDVKSDSRFAAEFDGETGFETRSIVAVPLVSKDRVLGVIELLNVLDSNAFGDRELRLLQTLADFSAIAIENARAVQRIRELTVTDDVTALFNARYLQQSLEQEFRRCRRAGQPLSIIFLDLDHFKTVNDTHGHLVGSEVLRETALILRDSLRATDIATRYGGDEFVLLLPETAQDEAIMVAERIRTSIGMFRFGIRHGVECRLTASFGIATLPDDTEDSIELIRLADQAMYWVKEHNRNAVATASVLKAEL